MAYRDDELLEMKPRDKGAPCKRFVIELDAATPSSVNSSDFLIAASHAGSRILQFTPSSATSRGVHCSLVWCCLALPLLRSHGRRPALRGFWFVALLSVPLEQMRACPTSVAAACHVTSVRCVHVFLQRLPAPVQSSG